MELVDHADCGVAVTVTRLRLASLAGAVTYVAGCQGATTPPIDDTWKVAPIPGGPAAFSGVAWTPDGLVISRDGDRRSSEMTLVDPGTWEARRLPAPFEGETCARIDEYGPISTSFGEAAWIARCFTSDRTRRYEIREWGAERGVRTLRPGFDSREIVQGIALSGNPPFRVIATVGSRICQTVVELVEAGARPVQVEVQGPGGRFDLADPAMLGDCATVGLVSHVSASSKGVLVLVASTAAIDRDGPQRLQAPRDAYIVDSDGTSTRIPLGISNVGGLAFSPDGASVLVSGELDDAEGTWILDTGSGSLDKIAEFRLSSPSWAAGGMRVVGQRTAGDTMRGESEIVVLTAR